MKRGESLVRALKREVHEETGLRVQIASLLGVLDRRDKDAITLLFAAVPDKTLSALRKDSKEIKATSFQMSLPKKIIAIGKAFLVGKKRPHNQKAKDSSINAPTSAAPVTHRAVHSSGCLLVAVPSKGSMRCSQSARVPNKTGLAIGDLALSPS